MRTQIKEAYRKLGVSTKIALGSALVRMDKTAHATEEIRADWRRFQLAFADAQTFIPDKIENALIVFHELADAYPMFALPHAGISFCVRHRAFTLPDALEANDTLECALASAHKGLSADIFSAPAHLSCGRALCSFGDFSSALTHLETALDISPQSSWTKYMLFFVLTMRGTPEQAIEMSCYVAEAKLSPSVLAAYQLTKALAHIENGDLAEATHYATSCIANPNAYNHMRYVASLILCETDNFYAVAQIAEPWLCTEMKMSPLQNQMLGNLDGFQRMAIKHKAAIRERWSTQIFEE